MAFYNTCDHCGATLDPGEPCDCRKARAERKEHVKATKRIRKIKRTQKSATLFPINMTA